MIVVNSNLIAYLYISGDRSNQAEQVYAKDSQWAAPLLWRSEMRNILALYLRKKILTLKDAHQIIEKAMEMMGGSEYEVNSRQVLSLAESSGCSAYDCEYVALAEDLGVSLVTADRQVLHQFPKIAISPEQFLGN